MQNYSSWNHAGQLAKKQAPCHGCDPNRLIHAVVRYPDVMVLKAPIYARDFICSCGATGCSGQYIPYDKSWMCMNDLCPTNGFSQPMVKIARAPEKRQRSLSEFGVPPDLCSAKGSDLMHNPTLASLIHGIASQADHFLLLAGKNGRGKSYASAAAMYEYMQRQKDPHMAYINSVDLHQAWKMEICSGGSGYMTISKYAEYEMLILDDLGINTPTDNYNAILYAIIDKRKGKATIISTNMNAKEFKERFGEPIFSRVMSGKVFKVEGKDRRLTALKSDEWENSK